MATKREKKVVVSGVTQQEMETAFGRYAVADARLAKINAQIDLQVSEIREKQAGKIAELTEEKDSCFEIMQTYAQENPEIFGKKKSVDGAHGTFGFRTGTPKLKLKKGFTWGGGYEPAQRVSTVLHPYNRRAGKRQAACRSRGWGGVGAVPQSGHLRGAG